MEQLKAALAVALICSLTFPAPFMTAQELADKTPVAATPRPVYSSTTLRGDDRILHALNRFTFGPKPGDLEAVRQTGLDKWFDQQLHPNTIDQADLNARLAEFPAMQWNTQDLIFRLPGNARIRQATNGVVSIPANGTLHAVYENQIYRYQAKKENKAEKAASPAPTPNAINGGVNSTIGAQASGGIDMNADANGSGATGSMSGGVPSQVSNGRPGAPTSGGTPAIDAMQAPSMTAAAPTPPDQPAFDPQEMARILALPPVERVTRMQQMQPEVFESFIKSLKPVQRQAMMADLNPELKEVIGALENPERQVGQELFGERLTRDIYSDAQLQEVMTDFWLNHFNVYVRKNEQMPYYLVSYERDVIRPLALGKFEDLLEAVAHSPAMLLYLDNAESVGPNSIGAERAKMIDARRPNAKRQAPAGLNENYARELMELHTLGVNGGYTQADVTQVARVLTGWGVDRPQFGGGFEFNPNRHEPGTKTVMGTKIKENGEMEGRELLHLLATRPATAQFISRKLAIRFVSDDPPQALVDRLASAYLASGGDIPTVLKTLFHSPEFWATSDYRAKVKTPLEFVVSAVRASNANIQNFDPLFNSLRQLGMPLYGSIPPTGYKWDASDWVSTGALVDRMNFALSLASNKFPGITVAWAPDLDMNSLDSDAAPKQVIPTPESEESRLEPLLVAGGVSDATRAAALQQFAAQSAQNAGNSATAGTPSPVANARPGAPSAGSAETAAAHPTLNANNAFRMGHPANRAPVADQYEREDQVLAGLLLGSPEFQRR